MILIRPRARRTLVSPRKRRLNRNVPDGQPGARLSLPRSVAAKHPAFEVKGVAGTCTPFLETPSRHDLVRASCFELQHPIDPNRFFVKRRFRYWVQGISVGILSF